MISQKTIDEVNSNIDIVEVVGEFVKLKSNGTNYKACCPFHDEKSPSFVVSATKGIYKCFGCGKSGGGINFIMEHESMTYPESIEWLCNFYNIPFENEMTEEERKKHLENESLYSIHESVCNHYQQKDISYWKQRGYTQETIELFRLGNSTSDIKSLNLDVELMKKASILSHSGNDFFKNRAIVPIFALNGKVCGFGGRTLDDSKGPKYLNSKNTEIYDKSLIVYGLHHAKKSISKLDECFIVEGYTDVMSMYQNKIENSVSSSGTSLTEYQLKQIGRFTKNITLILDGDAAGLKAVERGIILALEGGFNVKVVMLPKGEDPDSMAKKGGFLDYIKKNSKDFLVYKTESNKSDFNRTPTERTAKIKEIINLLKLIPDSITQLVYTNEAANILNIDSKTFSNFVLEGKKPQANKPTINVASSVNTHEEELVRIMVEYGCFEVSNGHKFIEVIQKELKEFVVCTNPLLKKIESIYFKMELSGEYKDLEWFITNVPEVGGIIMNHSNISNAVKITSFRDNLKYILTDVRDVLNNYLKIEIEAKIKEMVVATEDDLIELNRLTNKKNSL